MVGAAAGWSAAARAQQPERLRRIGVLFNAAADNPDYQAWLGAFREALQELGWVEGRNVRIDIYWGTNPTDLGSQAAELVALAPDVILAPGTTAVGH